MTTKTYKTPEAFRGALHDRIKKDADRQKLPFNRVRMRWIFERFLARVVQEFTDCVALKGGLALELRLGAARSTKDVDLRMLGAPDELLPRLQSAGHKDLGDFMRFEVRFDTDRLKMTNPGIEYEGYRLQADCKIAGKVYGSFGVDVVFGGVLEGVAEPIVCPDILNFIGVPPPTILVIPIVTHIAEKLHAYTFPWEDPEQNSRLKDFPDLALLASVGDIDVNGLRSALRNTFKARNTHELVSVLLDPRSSWTESYERLAEENGLAWPTLDAVTKAVHEFLDPVLTGAAVGRWSAAQWSWHAAAEGAAIEGESEGD